MAKNKQPNLGALVFWMILIATAIIPMFYLMVWGYTFLNMRALALGVIFSLFIIFTFALDFEKHLYPAKSTFASNTFSFSLGLGFGTLIGLSSVIGGQQSIFALFTVSQQYLLSEITAQLPLFWANFSNIIGAPVAEEMLFLISIPVILFLILEYVAKQAKVLKNPFVQIAIVAGIVAPLFAYFHVGNVTLTSFVVAAIFFRVLVIGLVHGDQKTNILPLVALIPAFGVGYHMANNLMYAGGWGRFIQIMTLEPWGYVILLMIAIFLISGIWYGVGKLLDRRKK